MKLREIRPKAVGVFRRNDEILVFEGYDAVKDEVYYRPLGGAIEFGEYGYQALQSVLEIARGFQARSGTALS